MAEKVACEYCGKEFSPKGIEGHKRNCSENPDNPKKEEATVETKTVVAEVVDKNYYEGHPKRVLKLRGLLSRTPFEQAEERAKIMALINSLKG